MSESHCTPQVQLASSQLEITASLFVSFLKSQQATFDEIKAGLIQIETQLNSLTTAVKVIGSASVSKCPAKECYTPAEVAELLGKRPYTVREWCRLERINASKRPSGRGEADEWEIAAEEIERYRNHGLLPIPTKY